ncbi:hypothetical protein V493_04742 [Pseudogymnoascus sp. VKM F-4281 (FW-2241)]|nr:hypothetical protein V493_04742 [Pseudogymnoascus sp. VKM F-4281 (FW-2241)]
MSSGLRNFVHKKNPQHGGNENDVPVVTPAELAQRQNAAREMRLKLSGPAAGRRSQSTSGPGVPFRDAAIAPARVGSPLNMQQAGVQNGFATQGRNQINEQQAYAQMEPLWAESTLGSDSLGTVRDNSSNQYNDGKDHEFEDTQGPHIEDHDQDVGFSDQRSDTDPEEEEVDQNIAGYHQNFNAHLSQPGGNQTSIPVRGAYTNRFMGGFQAQQQSLPAMEADFPNGKRVSNGVGQNYNQKNMPGHLGHQVEEVGGQQHDIDTFAPSEVDEDTIHSIAGNGGKHSSKASKRQADDISNIDFDKDTLFNMPYQELENQPFDEDPGRAKTAVSPFLTGLPISLNARMELFKTKSAEERAEFLATLSLDEWEEAGDWLMHEFSSMMSKIGRARRERRKIAAEFEKKLAARDAEVRDKTDGVTVALKGLKNGGQDLLRGKTPT